jgi:hypothetical protein
LSSWKRSNASCSTAPICSVPASPPSPKSPVIRPCSVPRNSPSALPAPTPAVPITPGRSPNTPARLSNRTKSTRQKVSQLHQTSAHPAGSRGLPQCLALLTPLRAGARPTTHPDHRLFPYPDGAVSPCPDSSPPLPLLRHPPRIYLPTRQVIPNFPGECSSYFALAVYTRNLST